MYAIGVHSLPVVALTGTFIGMVLAVQSYTQFREFGLETQLGGVINMSMFRELGPVLAATMLAGRVGSAMAAELGTMRVTEQIDALTSMGANPIHYLVVPRFLGCLLDSRRSRSWPSSWASSAARRTASASWASTSTTTGQRAAVRRKLGPVLRHRQERVLRRRDRRDQLLPRLQLPARRRGRRPGGDDRVRVLVRRDHHPRFVGEHRARSDLPGDLARGADAVWSVSCKLVGLDWSLKRRSPQLQHEHCIADSKATWSPPNPSSTSSDLNVQFGRQHVLRDIDLRVPRGQTLAVIGESGCGKTVLLKTIIGLVAADRAARWRSTAGARPAFRPRAVRSSACASASCFRTPRCSTA